MGNPVREMGRIVAKLESGELQVMHFEKELVSFLASSTFRALQILDPRAGSTNIQMKDALKILFEETMVVANVETQHEFTSVETIKEAAREFANAPKAGISAIAGNLILDKPDYLYTLIVRNFKKFNQTLENSG